jgi:hypothetical protein
MAMTPVRRDAGSLPGGRRDCVELFVIGYDERPESVNDSPVDRRTAEF